MTRNEILTHIHNHPKGITDYIESNKIKSLNKDFE